MNSVKLCDHCQSGETFFSKKSALKELKKYHKKGPGKTTRMIVNFLKNKEIDGFSLLDIGGGIGAIQHELIKEGITQTIHVDATAAYLEVSQEEAERQGHADKSTWVQGDFVDLAPTVPHADIVTLENVVCCYPDYEQLIISSSSHAKKYYGLVYPKRTLLIRLGTSIFNLYFKIKRISFRHYIHPPDEIRSLLKARNFKQSLQLSTWLDLIEVYEKAN